MAKGRMIYNDISLDPELNTMSVEAHLCYLLAFTHLDRDGLIDAHPNRLWATICPFRTEFFDRIPPIVDEWIRAGRVQRYSCGDGRSALFFKDFRRYNVRLKYTNEAASTFPPPPGWVRSKAGLIPADPELRERMAENYDGRSQYRAALEAHLTGSLSRPTRDELATQSPVSRLQDQIQDDLVDDGDQIIHPIHPRNRNRGGVGGNHHPPANPAAPTHFAPDDAHTATHGQHDLLATLDRPTLEAAAWQLGSLLNFHTDWHDYRRYLIECSHTELLLLLRWIKRHHDDPTLSDGAKSLVAMVRANIKRQIPVYLTGMQLGELVQAIMSYMEMEVWEDGKHTTTWQHAVP